MPNQPHPSGGARGTVEMGAEYVDGLCDLDGFSHIILLCHFYQSRDHSFKVVLSLDDELRGLFATRSPNRPNPIGLSVVRLEKIVAHKLFIMDIDILDETPVLDIKPYIGEFSQIAGARFGWLQRAREERESAK